MFHRSRFFRAHLRDRHFQRGDLKYVILELIHDKPRYGYEIITALEERSHGFYSPSPGSIYPTLQMLEEAGYVGSDQQDGKKVYTITDDGMKFLEGQSRSTERIRRYMKDHWNPRDRVNVGEAVQDFGRLGGLLARHSRRLDPEKMKQVREVISHAYNEVKNITGE
ncbi:MAG: PadR family transcriptional regulator [Dehalococcoidales bacterium]|nr:MAG: PadR family transcriptional regulator [Dehalococcoidales bacterium]